MNRENFYTTPSKCVTMDYYKGWNAAVDRVFDELDKQNSVKPIELYEFRSSIPEITEAIGNHIDSGTDNEYEPWM